MPSDAPHREALPDVAATHALAARLADRLGPGDVLALEGDLGAGKTELTRGLAAALGSDPSIPVRSPSYLLLNEYPGGRLTVAHFDAYFMDSADDLERAGLADLRAAGHVVVVEWADKVAEALPDDALWVHLEAGADPGSRSASLSGGRKP